MHLYFARHGETDWNVKKWIQGTTDIELNQEGLDQAHALADTLVGLNISCIFTSKLMRASKTAQIVADVLKIPCIETDGLQEICFGEWEGHTWYDVKCGWEELYEHWKANRCTTHPPKGESYDELAKRVIAAVKGIINEKNENILIVTHSACIMILLAYINATPIETMSKDYPVPNAQAIEISVEKIAALP